jgi:hypothetical protein
MPYTLFDLGGLAIAALLTVVVLVLPGYAIAAKTNVLGFTAASINRRIALALLVAYAVMPVLQSMAARLFGLKVAVAISLALAAVAVHHARGKLWPQLTRHAWSGLAIGFAMLAFLWIDFAWNGRLYPSLLIADLVKHAATVRALVEAGAAPPTDPFFLRDSLSSYYYFYYTPSALIEVLGLGLIDSRAAVGGQLYWTAVAVVGLAVTIAERGGFLRAGERVPMLLLLALMACGGFQIISTALLWLGVGFPWPAQVGWYTEEMTSWPLSMVWVPHHLAALLASWTSFLILIEAQTASRPLLSRQNAIAVVMAGCGFASACGLSTWVTVGAVATMAVWCISDLLRRRWLPFGLLMASGIAAIAIAALHLFDLMHYRSYGEFPIAFQVRIFSFAELIGDAFGGTHNNLLRFFALPLNYLFVGGIALIGSVIYWRNHFNAAKPMNETARVLTYSAAASLVIGSLFASKIMNNDLGWRIVLFVQMAALIWTLAVLMPLWRRAHQTTVARVLSTYVPRLVMIAFALGYVSVLHDLIAIRGFYPLGMWIGDTRRDPFVDYDARQAYLWMAQHTSHEQVFQHNPDLSRAMAYGLYGRHRTAIADRHNSKLFGPSKDDVAKRLAAVKPVFTDIISAVDVRSALTAEGVDAVVVAANDPVWMKQAPWVFASPAMFATNHIRVLNVKDLRDKP